MSHLLDTHALLWWLFADPRLSRRSTAVLRDPVFVDFGLEPLW
jgi:PIN domain nuclease of toxin-antitoxin system